jgi:hypothetical protein
LGKRRRFSRWRRLPGAYRFGDDKPADPNAEPQRLSLYVPGTVLDRAEMQAVRLGFADAQEYCTELLLKAIEAEHVREQMADVEAKRGPLEGFHEIADDPEYLSELSAAAASRGHDEPAPTPPVVDTAPAVPVLVPDRVEPPAEITFLEPLEPAPPPEPVPRPVPVVASGAEDGPAAEVVLRHAGQAGDDPYAFLPCLRRGEAVPPAVVAELAQALSDLEQRCRDDRAMDRRLTFALHRLAFESQILQTDAWPGTFDVWTVDMVRAVQEAVERILSGQDIRYYPVPASSAEPGASTQPEAPP